MDLGINLSAATFYATQFPWVNFFKQTQEWRTQNSFWVPGGENAWDTGYADYIPKDANGYPLSLPYNVPEAEAPQVVSTIMFREIDGQYPAGKYIFTYDGEGEFAFSFDAAVISEEPGRIELHVNPSDAGIRMEITSSKEGDHVRNIRFVHEDEQEGVFTQSFLDFCDHFSMIRFMNWQLINGPDGGNGSKVFSISQSYSRDHYTQVGEFGVSPGYIVDLCNELKKDAWICFPHLASDSFVEKYAGYLKKHLDPDVKIRFELSNEVWNKAFKQAQEAEKFGLYLKLSDDPFVAQMRMYATRLAQVSKIVKEVFSDEPGRVRFVLGGQAANTFSAQTVLEYKDTAQWVDDIAIAPYFGIDLGNPATLGSVIGLSVEEILATCIDNIKVEVAHWMDSYVALGAKFGKKIIAYEGGQHLVGFGGAQDVNALTDLFIAANESPGMEEVYDEYLKTWEDRVGGHMNLYRSIGPPSKWGSWGLVRYQNSNWNLEPKFKSVTKNLDK